MKTMDKNLFIKWATKRMEFLKDRIDRDFGGGLVDDLGKFNEIKMIKEAAERGEFDIKVWE
ncbi:hypothetical protein [Sporosarcina globispora]|nr:hypothetical protein [Sporosarcina globispora]